MTAIGLTSPAPRNLLCLVPELTQVGGIQGYNRALIEAVRRAGGRVTVVERRPGGLVAKAGFALRAALAVLVHRPDVVLCAHLHFGPLALMFRRLLGIPYGVAVYGIETEELSNAAARRTIEESGLVIYLFEHTLSLVEKQVAGSRSKAFSLLSAVDGNRFSPRPPDGARLKALGLEGCRVVLTLGRMSRSDGDNKGYRRVLEAFPQVLEVMPEARYLLVGGGDDTEGVRTWVREHGLEGKVVMAGPPAFEELADFYNLAEVFVLPSKQEGFPAIVMLEALACGLPVIGGDQPGAEGALMQGALGIVVPSEDRAALAQAILRVLRSDEWKNRQRIREQSLVHYGIERFDREVRDLLGRLNALTQG